MSKNFVGLINQKYKKSYGKVKFCGIRLLNNKNFEINKTILVSNNYGLLSSNEIESLKKTIKKLIGKTKRIKISFHIYPYISLTGKPLEVRMGRGKGNKIRKWVSFIKPGKILLEIKNLRFKRSFIFLKKVSEKLSVSTKILFFYRMKSQKNKI